MNRSHYPYLYQLLLALLIVSSGMVASVDVVVAQQPGEDSTWTDDDLLLDPDEFDFDDELISHYSGGWFPSAFAFTSLSATTDFIYSDVFDRGSNIQSHSFSETPFAFTWRDPYAGGERAILEPNSDEETDECPTTRYDEYGLTYLIGLPMPAILRLRGVFQMQDGLLYSLDTTRRFLGFDGTKRFLKEVGVVYLEEYLISASAGLNIPIYGVFFDSELTTVSSYYYLHASIAGTYALVSRGTQYVQIANAKEELRYRNGTDTTTLISKRRFEDLNRFRTSYEFGIGWNFAIESFGFTFETFFSLPITAVLRDAEWRQYAAGVRIGLGYQWK
jgi:hypothetical protein